jgi:hypothetical protein
MNECLTVKWIWKIHQEPDELWIRILKAKYMDEKGFFGSNEMGKVKHLFKWGLFLRWEVAKCVDSGKVAGHRGCL